MRDDFPVVSRPAGEGMFARAVHEIACSRCPAKAVVSAHAGRLPPHTVALKFGQRGWRVAGVGKHLCPACAAAARPARKPLSEDSAMPPKAAKPAIANENTAPHASPEASRSIALLYMLLDEKYDREKKAYATGYDDARVAKETDLALALVVERRERDFGPLVKDTTREDMATATLALATEIADLEGQVESLQRLAAAATNRIARVKVSLNDLRKLQDRLLTTPVEKAA